MRWKAVDECVKVRASSQVGVTERLLLVSSPAACVLFSAEYQVFCTRQVQNALLCCFFVFFFSPADFQCNFESFQASPGGKTNIPLFLIFAIQSPIKSNFGTKIALLTDQWQAGVSRWDWERRRWSAGTLGEEWR